MSLVVYIGLIAFGLAPTTDRLSQSGYTTTDLQDSSTRQEADVILESWEGFSDVLIQVTIIDYLFIIAGIFLFVSLNSIIYQKLEDHPKLMQIPALGIIFTLVSRSFDALENLWTLLIYTNPEGYSTILITLMRATSFFKWVFVVVEFGLLITGGLVLLILRFQNSSSDESILQ